MTHTPGKLVFCPDNLMLAFEREGKVMMQVIGDDVSDNERADLRRLAACWNLCEGVPTELVEEATNKGSPLWRVEHLAFRLRTSTAG